MRDTFENGLYSDERVIGTCKVSAHAGPEPLLRPGHQAGQILILAKRSIRGSLTGNKGRGLRFTRVPGY